MRGFDLYNSAKTKHFFIDGLGRTVMRHPIHFRDGISSYEINEEDNDWFKREENKSPVSRVKHNDLTDEHKSALLQYSKSSYAHNKALIGAHEHDNELGAYHSDQTKKLDSVTNRPIGSELHLYSGLGFHPGQMMKHSKDGVIHLPAYTSMTHDKNIASWFADESARDNNLRKRHILHIHMKPTDKGVGMVDTTGVLHKDEKETVLPRGTNLKINSTPEISTTDGKIFHIWHGEVHSQPEPSTKNLFHSKKQNDINDSYVNHPDIESRIAAASRPTLKPHHIDKLISGDKSSDYQANAKVRAEVAEHQPNLSDEHVSKLAGDEFGLVRSHLLKNPHLKEHQVNFLIHNPSEWISSHAIKHRNLNDDQVSSLLFDESKKRHLAKNPYLKPQHIDQLVNDSDEKVKSAIAGHPRLTSKHIDHLIKYPATHEELSSNPNIESRHIDALMRSEHTGSPKFLPTLAKNPALREQHIKILANHKDDYVRKAVASRDDLLPEIAQHLANDKYGVVRDLIRHKYPHIKSNGSKISESFPEFNSMRRLVECVILDTNK